MSGFWGHHQEHISCADASAPPRGGGGGGGGYTSGGLTFPAGTVVNHSGSWKTVVMSMTTTAFP